MGNEMKKTEQSRRAYNKKAENYENTYDGRVTRPIKQMMLDAVNVQNGHTVIDVACGTGALIAEASKKAEIQAFGIDISEQMIKVAEESYQGISFRVASAVPLPFEDASADVIMVSAAFHHFENPQSFADECFRVLRDGGEVYIGDFCGSPVVRCIMNFVIRFLRTGDVKIYSEKELTSFFTKAEFEVTDIRKDGPRIVLISRKK